MSILDLFKSKKDQPVEQPTEPPKKEKKEPFIQLTGDEIDPKTGMIKIDLEWNDEFIDYLKQHGYVGTNENLIIKKYLESLYRDMLNRSDDSLSSEFE